jgi:hypothetical protein
MPARDCCRRCLGPTRQPGPSMRSPTPGATEPSTYRRRARRGALRLTFHHQQGVFKIAALDALTIVAVLAFTVLAAAGALVAAKMNGPREVQR